MNGLKQWIGQWEKAIKVIFGAIIALVAVVIIGIQISKAIWASKNHKMGEVAKHIAFAVIAGILAVVGIGGLSAIIDKIKPDDQLIPQS